MFANRAKISCHTQKGTSACSERERNACDTHKRSGVPAHSCFAGGHEAHLRHGGSWPRPLLPGRGLENTNLVIVSPLQVVCSGVIFSFAACEILILVVICVCCIFSGKRRIFAGHRVACIQIKSWKLKELLTWGRFLESIKGCSLVVMFDVLNTLPKSVLTQTPGQRRLKNVLVGKCYSAALILESGSPLRISSAHSKPEPHSTCWGWTLRV